MMFIRDVECTKCRETFSSHKPLTVCKKCGGALFFQYDLNRVARKVSKNTLKNRTDSFWKFIELLPISLPKNIVSLGEPYTPVLPLPRVSDKPFKNVYVKDDGRLPTGTFKARGMAIAVSTLKELGIRRIAVPSAGNAASALAAYAAPVRMGVYAFMPKDVPEPILKECIYLGAKVYLVDGLINDAGEIANRLETKYGWYNISTNKQPYRVEGYKAMAYEIAEQFDWKPPKNIIFPTGGGEGTIGLWKGFKELNELGWIRTMPRLIIVQSEGCAPLVRAFKNNEPDVKEPWREAHTVAAGLNVPMPFASYLIFRALRETKGAATAVGDREILSSMKVLLGKGIYACPEAAATLAALEKLHNERALDEDETTLLYLTGDATKYLDVLRTNRKQIPVLERNATSLD